MFIAHVFLFASLYKFLMTCKTLDIYFLFQYNKATQHWCPDGLHFNPAAKHYEYPCAYPTLVQCTTGRERSM